MKVKILLFTAILMLGSFSVSCNAGTPTLDTTGTPKSTEDLPANTDALVSTSERTDAVKVADTSAVTTIPATETEVATPSSPLKIVCVGDSITYGTGSTSAATDSYPAALQLLLGDDYKVINCGNAQTACLPNTSEYFNTNATTYTATAQYMKSIKSSPDIVFIMLGTNDAKNIPSSNETAKTDFYNALYSLAKQYMELESKPTVYILTSPYRTEDFTKKVNTQDSIVPVQKQVAEDLGLDIIDLNLATQSFDNSLYYDRLHFTTEGYKALAKEIYNAFISFQ